MQRFFDYESDQACKACAGRCRHGYLPPADPSYARVAVCHGSLNLLHAAIHQAWTLDVEQGCNPREKTAWLVEIAHVLRGPAASVSRLYACAIENINPDVLMTLHACGAQVAPEDRHALARSMLRTLHLAQHRPSTAGCTALVRAFVETLNPPDSIMHSVLLCAVSFGACSADWRRHLALIAAVLGPVPQQWWSTAVGQVVCALRWSRRPSLLIEFFGSKGMGSTAAPSWEFEAARRSDALCHRGIMGIVPLGLDGCTSMRDVAVPQASVPFHTYAILFSRIAKLPMHEVVQTAQMLHRREPARSDLAEELRCSARTLFELLLRNTRTLECAGCVLSAVPKIFPPELLKFIPSDAELYSLSPLMMQVALARHGVSAADFELRMQLNSPQFAEIRLKVALVLAQAGAAIQPHDPCWQRWMIETVASKEADAVTRFLALCDYGAGQPSPLPNEPRFAELAVRTMLLYNQGLPTPKLVDFMERMRFKEATASAKLWCRPYSHLRHAKYPRSCRTAVETFILALRRRQDAVTLPKEMVLAVLEAAYPLSFGRCTGPWEPTEQFPLTTVELEVLSGCGGIVERIGGH